MTMTADRLVLRTLLDTYPYTEGLKVPGASDRIEFSFEEVRPIYDGFPRTVRTSEFALSELATVTYLQSCVAGRPFILLPIGLLTRFHHRSTVARIDSGIQHPADLAGRRIGVRAYTQTTVVWARGILEHEYGLDSSAVTWVTLEEPHVPEFREPPNVIRAATGTTLESLLLSGAVDAAIVGRERPTDERIRALITDPAEELSWYRRTGVHPINHVLVLRPEVADEHPWLIDELGTLFAECRAKFIDEVQRGIRHDGASAALLGEGIDPIPMGTDSLRPALELAIDYCQTQGLIPTRLDVDELFDHRVATW